jgi:hypothetical protein
MQGDPSSAFISWRNGLFINRCTPRQKIQIAIEFEHALNEIKLREGAIRTPSARSMVESREKAAPLRDRAYVETADSARALSLALLDRVSSLDGVYALCFWNNAWHFSKVVLYLCRAFNLLFLNAQRRCDTRL